MAEITINGVTLDPVQDTPALESLGLFSADAAHSNYILVQTRAPLTAPQKAELTAAGVRLLEHVPEQTYICEYDNEDLERIRALPFVAWVSVYLEGFKIAPELHAATHAPLAHLLTMQTPAGALGAGKKLVNIVLHRGANAELAGDKIAIAAGVPRAGVDATNGRVRLSVDAERLDALSRIDEVRHIEAIHEKRLWNNKARQVLAVDTVAAATRFEGAGQIVAVCDTGFDTGDAANPHPAFEGRVKQLYAYGRPGDPSDPNGHGTHVCGSVLGNGMSGTDGAIQGTAPAATLVMQSIEAADGTLGGLNQGLTTILQQAYDDGARVHSNSWGDTNNHYTADSQDVDDFVWNHRDSVIVFAAGNAGQDANKDGTIDGHSVGSPGTAKNCITVGASENNRPGFFYVDGDFRFQCYGQGWPAQFPVKPISTDTMAENPNGLAAFSSRGPTADGRIKPDVVAPGTAILSTRSRAAGVGNGWGPSGDPQYFYDGGTSMATPLVSGCAAVVREFLQQNGHAQPSAALVKALIVNGATALGGQYTPSEAGVVPNPHQGFGRVDLASAIGAGSDREILQFWDEDQALDTGDEQAFPLTLKAGVTSLKVTLVWTDPAGESLQNDLDLTVTTPGGEVVLGNAGPGSTIPDRTNNVEQVTMQGLAAGDAEIRVKAYRCAIDPQSFALVARVGY